MVCTSGLNTQRRCGRWRWLNLPIAALLTATSGCSLLGVTTADDAPNPQHLEQPTITVGAIAAASAAPLYLAQQQGLFAQQGLTVTIVTTQGGAQAIPQLLSGGLNITLTNDAQAITAQLTHAADLKFVSNGTEALSGTYTVDALPRTGIHAVGDLAGKTIAVSSLGDLATLALRELLQINNVPAASVQFTQIPFANTEQALKTGQVDAAMQTAPYSTQTEQETGAVPAIDPFRAGGPTANMDYAAYVALAAWAQTHPHTLAAFQRAMIRAEQQATTDRTAVERILPTYTKISAGTARIMLLPGYPSSLDPTNLDRVVYLMRQYGPAPRPSASFSTRSMVWPAPSS
jgi:NitT/TauT family transport system substrate-binding protein